MGTDKDKVRAYLHLLPFPRNESLVISVFRANMGVYVLDRILSQQYKFGVFILSVKEIGEKDFGR